MGFWEYLIIAIIGTFIGGLLLSLIFPPFSAFLKKIWSKITNRPLISRKMMEELRILESIENPLLRINQIPSFPDSIKAIEIRNILIDVSDKMKKINSKELNEIKTKLIEFADNADKLHANMNSLNILKMLGRDSAINLVQEIREIVSKTIKDKMV